MIDTREKAFFRRDGQWFIGTDAARGPWSADACHAGPVTGVIARACEQAAPLKQLTRLTVTFLRPLPMSGFRVDAELEREGLNVATVAASMTDADGRQCASATSLHLVAQRFDALPTATVPHPSFEEATSGQFPVEKAIHDLPFFGNGIDIAYPPGESGAPGPTTMWMRALPMLEDEKPSPFQSLCPLADCGNGISRNCDFNTATFVNPDLTVVAYRLPESDWLASEAISFWEPSGIGMSHATLYDTRGALGIALQSLIIRPVG